MLYRTQKLLKRTWANWRFAEYAQIDLPAAIVSFTFDDAPASAFRVGGKLLAEKSYGGTFYIALSLLNQPASIGGFTMEDIKQAVAAGHELGCHTFGHIDISRIPFREVVDDIAYNQSRLEQLLPTQTFRHFSYPFGSQTLAIKKHLGQQFKTARGIGHGLNVGKTDMTNLKAVKLYRDRFELAEIARLIKRAKHEKAWLIFYTHDVRDTPTPYGCTPSYFAAVIQLCEKYALPICSIDQACKQIQYA